MEAKKYNQVTPEILEQFKAIVPGKVYAGEEINSDYLELHPGDPERSRNRSYRSGGCC